jgi:glycosyltransferase involved in cell wall biosynthesis
MSPTITPKTCIFTIAANNYLHFVRSLMDSVASFAPNADRFLALCDEPDGSEVGGDAFRVLPLSDLPIPELDRFIFQYTLLEISTAIKPFVIERLLTQYGYDQVIYFDPDIRIYRPLDEMMRLLEAHSVLLTPHLTEPMNDDKRPNERDIMRSGVYNLGFIGLRRTPATKHLLKWWQGRLLRDCVVDFERGLFVDQKWMDLAPLLCEEVYINRDPSWNVAYWNLHGRRVEETNQGYAVNGIPLTFYHFSGFDPDSGVFSKHQDRFTMSSVAPAVRALCADYGAELRRHGYPGSKTTPYAHANFPDGTPIPSAARKLYRENRDAFATDWNRFQKWLNEPAETEGRNSPLVSRLAYEVYRMPTHAQLKGLFPDVLGVHARSYAEWFVANAGELIGIPEYFLTPMRTRLAARENEDPTPPLGAFAKTLYQFAWRWKNLTHAFLPLQARQKIHGWLFKRAYAEAEPQPVRTASSRERPSKGLNLIDYAQADHGDGDAARSTMHSATAAGVPFSLVDYHNEAQSRAGGRVGHSRPRDGEYAFNLLLADANHLQFVVTQLDRWFFEGRYNIGYCNWELPDLSDEQSKVLDCFDEIWVPSGFCLEALSKKARKPVIRIPYGIDVEVPSGIGRAELGLPHEGFLFLSTVDALSVLQQKNPSGLVESFLRAKSSLPKDSRLVFRVTNADKAAKDGQEILTMGHRDPSIVLLSEHMNRPQTAALYNSVDCHVSMHRSEGFGLALAESMFLGKPVIATGWSGNMDFMTSWNSLPVKYKLVTLDADYGPWKKGNTWADPDIDHAAECMVRVATDRELCHHLAEAGRGHIRTCLSPAAVGAAIHARLVSICQARST